MVTSRVLGQMYKTTFFAHLARAGKSHPFFSQNFGNANSTALNVLKPKWTLVNDSNFFSSSWGPHGYNASNSSTGNATQSSLVAICGWDDNSWETDVAKRSRQPRGRTFVRRYSTGTTVRSGIVPDQGSDQRYNVVSAQQQFLVSSADEVDHQHMGNQDEVEVNKEITLSDTARLPNIVTEDILQHLLSSGNYDAVCDKFLADLDTNSLTTISYNLYFKALDSLDSSHGGANLNTYKGRASNVSQILLVFNHMVDAGMEPDATTYGHVLACVLRHRADIKDCEYAVAGYDFTSGTAQDSFAADSRERLRLVKLEFAASTAVDIFKVSRSADRNIQQVYTTEILDMLLHACNLSGRLADAILIFDHYQAANIDKTVWSYKYLIDAFSAAHDLTGAIECFNMWKQEYRNLPAHDYFIVYDAMVRAYCKCGKFAQAMQFFRSATRQHPNVRAGHYESTIENLASAGQFNEALEFADSKSDSSLSRALAFAVREAVLAGKIDVARQHFKRVTSLPAFDDIPRALWTFISSLIRHGHVDEAYQLVLKCIKHAMPLRLVHISMLISRCLAAGRVSDALDLLSHSSKRQLIFNAKDYSKARASLFFEICISEMAGHGQLDAVTVPKLVGICKDVIKLLPMSSYNSILIAWKHVHDPHTPTQNTSLLNSLCALSFSILCDAKGSNESFATYNNPACSSKPLQENLKWLIDQVQLAADMSLSINKTALKTLKEACGHLNLFKEVHAIEVICTRITAAENKQRHVGAPIPSSRHIFLREDDRRIDRSLNTKLFQLLNADIRYHPINVWQDQISGLLERANDIDSIISGDTCLRIISQLSRTCNADVLQTVLPYLENLILKAARCDTLHTAALAALYDTTIIAYNESYDNTTAQAYCDRILALNFLPSAAAYASFIARMDINQYKDSASRALTVLKETRRLGIQPNEFLINTVIAKLAKARRNDDALAIFDEMRQYGLQPNGVTYGTIINSCCRVGQTGKAEALFEEMEGLPIGQIRIAPYNTLMQHFIQCQKDRLKAFHYWTKLSQQSIKPTAHSYRLLIEALGHLEPADPEAATAVLATMRRSGIDVEAVHHAAIINMYALTLKDSRRATEYYNELVHQYPDYKKDEVLYQAIIEASVKSHDTTSMEFHLAEMKRNNVPVNAYITNLAIQGYSNADELERARILFDQLPTSMNGAKGKEPSTYENMIKLYEDHNMTQESLQILHLLREQEYPEAIYHRAEALISKAA